MGEDRTFLPGDQGQGRATLDTAREARDRGMQQAAENQPDHTAAAYQAIRRYLETHRTFFIDEFWSAHPDLPPGRYVGQAMQRAQTEGLMQKVPVVDTQWVAGLPCYAARPSVRSNLAPKWIYDSLIYQTQEGLFDG